METRNEDSWKLFVSIPFDGIKDKEDYRAKCQSLASRVETYLGHSIELVDGWIDQSCSAAETLGKSIARMARANVVIFAKGWDQARGCRLENAVTQSYDEFVAVLYEENLES